MNKRISVDHLNGPCRWPKIYQSCLKHRFRDEFQDEVQVDLPFLLPCAIEVIQELDDVAVVKTPHYVELAVLVTLVAQHPLDGHSLSCVGYLSLVRLMVNFTQILLHKLYAQ